MKVLIQQNEGGSYLRAGGGWTSKRGRALAFDEPQEATEYCTRNGIRAFRLRFCFADPLFDFSYYPAGVEPAASTPKRSRTKPVTGKPREAGSATCFQWES